MKTIIKKVQEKQKNIEVIRQAGEIIRAGGLVAFPTETVYGLGADALNEAAAKKTYAAKGRPSDNPLIIHIGRMEDLDKIAKNVPQIAYKIADAFWPGPLTMIFQKSDAVPSGTTGGLDTVAVRMPDYEIARELILASGGYVSAPSANTSGKPSPTSAEHVYEDLDGKIDMIIDGGMVQIGVESTILDMTVTPPMILRPGAVTKEMLEKLSGEVAVDHTIMDSMSGEKPKAPGMKYRHYAPKASLTIVEGELGQVIEMINQLALQQIENGFGVGIIATEETVEKYAHGIVKCVGSRNKEESVAVNLYGILRAFDKEQVSYIYSESFEENGIGSAVMNRLVKAAGHHIIKV